MKISVCDCGTKVSRINVYEVGGGALKALLDEPFRLLH